MISRSKEGAGITYRKVFMKKLKVLGIIALVAVLGIIACPIEEEKVPVPELSGEITINPVGPVEIWTELTATYSGEEEVSFQWAKDGTDIGETLTTNPCTYTPEIAGSYTVTVSAQGFSDKTSAAVTVTAPTDDWKTGTVWLQTKESKYAIDEDEGTVGEVKSETTIEWSIYKYANNKKYEQKYKTTNPNGNFTTYTKRDGLNEETSLDYSFIFNGEPLVNKTKSKKVYDSDTGLMVIKSTPVDEDGVEGTPDVYTVELLSDSNGIKTYKNTQGNFVYTNKIQNGRIIERKVEMTSASYTDVYTFPTNEVIRAKLPDFKLVTMTGDGKMYGNSRQEVTVVSNDESTLVIQVKTFSTSVWGPDKTTYVLDEQSDFTYTKFTFPIEPTTAP